jgi:hypothetical protein
MSFFIINPIATNFLHVHAQSALVRGILSLSITVPKTYYCSNFANLSTALRFEILQFVHLRATTLLKYRCLGNQVADSASGIALDVRYRLRCQILP